MGPGGGGAKQATTPPPVEDKAMGGEPGEPAEAADPLEDLDGNADTEGGGGEPTPESTDPCQGGE